MRRHLLATLALLLPLGGAGAQWSPVYEPARTPAYVRIAEVMKKNEFLEDAAAALNSRTRLQLRMTLLLRECGRVAASYIPARRTIVLCHELFEKITSGIDAELIHLTAEQRAEGSIGAVYFVLFHELGHALIHVLRLPILGREEDAADSIASYIMLNVSDPLIGVEGAVWFFMNARRQISMADFAAEHSLGPQRGFSLLCHAVGKNESIFSELAARNAMPTERISRCPAEYAQLRNSVRSLLGRHISVDE